MSANAFLSLGGINTAQAYGLTSEMFFLLQIILAAMAWTENIDW